MSAPPPLPAPAELYDSAPCGLLVASGRGELLHVNATLCRWLDYEPGELVGQRRFQDLLTMGGRIFHQTHLMPLLRMQGSVAEVKLELRRKDGAALPMMVNAAERAFEGQLLLHISAIRADDRHKYEQELLRQRQRAEQLLQQHEQDQRDLAATRAQAEDRALFAEQMVGIVSHDLRNPLSAIQMSAVLLGMGKLEDPQRVVLDRVQRSVGRAERLITDLLDFTQARLGGGLSIRRRPVDLHDVVADSIAELATAFPERVIRHLRSGPGACEVDADRIVQALGNLVANAVNYGAPEQPIAVATQGLENRFDISVHNMGPPIPAELLPHLFEPMVRGNKASGQRGVGLGLYNVRAIAQAHAGDVQVRSSAESGTTFLVSLPGTEPSG
jgi:sigma-B regulation protein RsbU (phosphoserine phosphatase)